MSLTLLEQQKTNVTGGNPLHSDLGLLSLLEKLETIESYSQFVEWKGEFLDRFEFFLAEEGSAAAEEAYQTFRQQQMEKVSPPPQFCRRPSISEHSLFPPVRLRFLTVPHQKSGCQENKKLGNFC